MSSVPRAAFTDWFCISTDTPALSSASLGAKQYMLQITVSTCYNILGEAEVMLIAEAASGEGE
jgi:hypothetical protein